MGRPSNAQKLRDAVESALREAGGEPSFTDTFIQLHPALAYDGETRDVAGLDDAIAEWKQLNPEMFTAPAEAAAPGITTVAESAPVTISVGIGMVTFRPGQRLDDDEQLLSLARHHGIALHNAEG